MKYNTHTHTHIYIYLYIYIPVERERVWRSMENSAWNMVHTLHGSVYSLRVEDIVLCIFS